MSEREVYKIIDKATGEPVGVYSRAYHSEYNFPSAEAALNANVNGIHKDTTRFRIAKYLITEEEVPE